MLRIEFIGNLGQDPDMRYTPSGTAVTNFNVAVNRKYKLGDGTEKEETTWIRVSAFGKLAEITNQYLEKGRQVFIDGKLSPDDNGNPRIWEGSDGQSRASFEVRADTVKFL